MKTQVSGFFFKAVVQSVLIFGGKMWVVIPRMGQVLGGFQEQVARLLTGWMPRQRSDGRWVCTSVEAAIEELGFDPMKTYIQQRHNTATQYIAMQPILDLCETA